MMLGADGADQPAKLDTITKVGKVNSIISSILSVAKGAISVHKLRA